VLRPHPGKLPSRQRKVQLTPPCSTKIWISPKNENSCVFHKTFILSVLVLFTPDLSTCSQVVIMPKKTIPIPTTGIKKISKPPVKEITTVSGLTFKLDVKGGGLFANNIRKRMQKIDLLQKEMNSASEQYVKSLNDSRGAGSKEFKALTEEFNRKAGEHMKRVEEISNDINTDLEMAANEVGVKI
jgi:hypothetical protein